MDLAFARELMVELQLLDRGITDDAVLDAFESVPRDRFADADDADLAYDDCALPLGDTGEALSDPYALAWLLQVAEVRPGHRVLEIGAGSGYLAALLAHVGAEVHAVEVHPELVRRARAILAELAPTVAIHQGDALVTLPGALPYDRIVAGAAVEEVPAAWLARLAPGGRVICQVGSALTSLTADGVRTEHGPAGFAALTAR